MRSFPWKLVLITVVLGSTAAIAEPSFHHDYICTSDDSSLAEFTLAFSHDASWPDNLDSFAGPAAVHVGDLHNEGRVEGAVAGGRTRLTGSINLNVATDGDLGALRLSLVGDFSTDFFGYGVHEGKIILMGCVPKVHSND